MATDVTNSASAGATSIASRPNNSDLNSKLHYSIKRLNGLVGFSNLPTQLKSKCVKKGFFFTLLVVGESGLGKSTLINTLFNTELYPSKTDVSPSDEIPKTIDIQSIGALIDENGVKLKLNIIDTPGFGDFIDNENSWAPIINLIEERQHAYYKQETRVNRTNIIDNRIHACLYFIAPTGHSLKELDIEFMLKLHKKVNLVPVIAKSDIMTLEELRDFKSRILEDIEFHNIEIFKPPYEQLDTNPLYAEIRTKIPFAIVGSTKEIEHEGKTIRGRQYPWGVIDVEDELQSDFTKLRQMLIEVNMEDLKQKTNRIYEEYRYKAINNPKTLDTSILSATSKRDDPVETIENERQLHESKMAKMEQDMKAMFEQKVQEKEKKLEESEEELMKRHKELKDAIMNQRKELEEKKKKLSGSIRPGTAEKAKKKGFPF